MCALLFPLNSIVRWPICNIISETLVTSTMRYAYTIRSANSIDHIQQVLHIQTHTHFVSRVTLISNRSPCRASLIYFFFLSINVGPANLHVINSRIEPIAYLEWYILNGSLAKFGLRPFWIDYFGNNWEPFFTRENI